MSFGLGGVLMMMFVLIAAVVGVYFIASNVGTTPFVDSSGNTTNASVNATQQLVGNVTGVAPVVATGIIVVLGILAVFVVIVFLLGSMAVSGRKGY